MAIRICRIAGVLLVGFLVVTSLHAQDPFVKARSEATEKYKEHWQKIAKASGVTIKVENTESVDVYKMISEKSGNVLDLSGYHPSASIKEKKLVSLDVSKKSFWETVELLEKQAPVRFRPGSMAGKSSVRLRTDPRSGLVVFPGPARLRLGSFEMQRRLALNFAEGTGVAEKLDQVVGLSFIIDIEPRIWACGVRVKLKKASDDTGRDLLAKVLGPRKWDSGLLKRGICIAEVRKAFLGSPAPTARKLALLEGKLELKLAPIIPPIKIENVEKTGQKFKFVGGSAELVKSKFEDKGQTVDLTLGFELSEGLAFGPSRGATLSPVLYCNDGSKLLPLKATYGNPQEYRFTLHGRQQPKFLEIRNPVGAREIDIPFSFKDIPLPVRTVRNQAEGDDAPKGTLPLSELAGSVVSLQLKDSSPEKIADVLSEQSGNKVRLLKGRSAPAAMSVSVDKVPFWAAMDKLGTHADVSTTGELHASVWAAAKPPTYVPGTVKTIGPIRAALREMQLQVDSRSDYAKGLDQGTEKYLFKVYADVLLEPKVNVVRQGMSLESCVISELEMVAAAKPFSGLPVVDDIRGAHLVSATRGYRSGALGNLPLRVVPMSDTVDLLRFFYFLETCEKWQDITVPATKEKEVVIDAELKLDWGGVSEDGEHVFIIERTGAASRLRPGFLEDKGRCVGVTKDGDRIKVKRFRAKPVEGESKTMMCWVTFAKKLTAEDKVILQMPVGLKTYAGYVDFKKVPLPQLKTE